MYFPRKGGGGAAGGGGAKPAASKARSDRAAKQREAVKPAAKPTTGAASKGSSGSRTETAGKTKPVKPGAYSPTTAKAAAAPKEEKKAEPKKAAKPEPEKKIVRIDLAINPADAASHDDKYTLMSDDGKKYRQTKTIKDDKVPGDKRVTLEFTDLIEGLRYSLEVDLGKEGEKYLEFKNLPLSDLTG